MNKKQLIVAWIGTILICMTLLFCPKVHYRTGPRIEWAYIAPICISLLVIGGLLIYTLRDKKK